MKITILATVMLMAGYFLILYAGVALIQDKKFFSSAPKEILAAVPDKKERFRGAHPLGWCVAVLALLLFAGAFGLRRVGWGQEQVRLCRVLCALFDHALRYGTL